MFEKVNFIILKRTNLKYLNVSFYLQSHTWSLWKCIFTYLVIQGVRDGSLGFYVPEWIISENWGIDPVNQLVLRSLLDLTFGIKLVFKITLIMIKIFQGLKGCVSLLNYTFTCPWEDGIKGLFILVLFFHSF